MARSDSIGGPSASRLGTTVGAAPDRRTTDVAQLVNSEGLFGEELRNRLFHDVSRQVRISCSVELLPNPDNRVTISSQKDSFGLPRPEIHFATDEYTKSAFGPALEVITAILRSMDATPTNIDRNPINFSGSGQIMGTCQMGFGKTTAVVDSDCRSFDYLNLYMAGGSTFPSCGTANPTITIAALALRAASHILATLPQFPAKP